MLAGESRGRMLEHLCAEGKLYLYCIKRMRGVLRLDFL